MNILPFSVPARLSPRVDPAVAGIGTAESLFAAAGPRFSGLLRQAPVAPAEGGAGRAGARAARP